LVVLERTSRQKADWARDLLVRAGGTVSVEEVWVTARRRASSVRDRRALRAVPATHSHIRMPDPARE
jgi:hypothetical protein